jgi:phospholipid-translocating ATPase
MNIQIDLLRQIKCNASCQDLRFQADILLLSTSEPEGMCYIETAELDGETNLKAKQALKETAEMEDNVSKIGEFDGEIVFEPPSNLLPPNPGAFQGMLTWQHGKEYSLDNEKMLLRGCVLRNTKWCYGVVIFAGRDTKLMKNSGKSHFKRTSLDGFINVLIIGVSNLGSLSVCSINHSLTREFMNGAV